MKTVIMAGGKGTRISSIASDIPKPMIPIFGKPILEHQIVCLREQGFTELILVTGHLGEEIVNYFRDGRGFGVNISYYQEREALGTAGALAALREELSEDFLLLNGDIVFDLDLHRLVSFHRGRQALATLVTHPNGHPFDSALVVTDGDGRVINWMHKEEPRSLYHNRVNAGIHVLSPNILQGLDQVKKLDLDRELLKPYISTGRIFAYDTPEYIKDMGTPQRYHAVCHDLKSGLVTGKNLRNLQKAIFLDRDGVINVHRGFLTNPDEMELMPGAAEAIAAINEAGWLAVVVTNQPVIARGECTLEQLDEIHQRMEVLLGEKGGYIDGLFFCPHHPDQGFPGERPEYKVMCECRKPKPGLLFAAKEKLNINLSASYLIGDSPSDIQAAVAAGVTPVYVGKAPAPQEAVAVYQSLADFVNRSMLFQNAHQREGISL